MNPPHAISPRKQLVVPLLRRESIGPNYHILTFDVPETIAASPGHFCMIRGAEWSDAPLLPRPMSFLTAGATPSVLIKIAGEGTTRMARAEPGEPFALLGPLGVPWKAPPPGRQALLVAGGVGVAPLLFLARELRAAGHAPSVLYGGRTVRDLPLDDELSVLADVVLTTEDGSRGQTGRVTDYLPALLRDDHEVFACGPHRMMAAVATLCRERDIPCQVSLETPMACGYGVCLGCNLPRSGGGYLYACTEGPCIDARAIDWDRSTAV